MALLALGALVVLAMASTAKADDPTLTVTVSASPSTVQTLQPGSPPGESTITINVAYVDQDLGTTVPVANTAVDVEFASGGTSTFPQPAGATLSDNSVTTDASGNATVTYTAGLLQGQDTITASASDSGNDATGEATVKTCINPSDATTCNADVPIPYNLIPNAGCLEAAAYPGDCLPALPEPLDSTARAAWSFANCVVNAADPTTCPPPGN